MLQRHDKDPYNLSHLNPKERLYFLRNIFERLNNFMKICLQTSLAQGKEDSFIDQKMEINADLHDIHIKLSNLLIGKWDRIELIEVRRVEKGSSSDKMAS